MSSGSKKSSKASTKKAPRKPRDLEREIDPKLFARGRKLAEQYTIVLQPHPRLGFFATSIEIPTVFVDGRTEGECLINMREALAVAVAVMLDAGETPPTPATKERRDRQINIRLTAKERFQLEHAAKQRGFRGVSDFVRNIAISEMRRSA